LGNRIATETGGVKGVDVRRTPVGKKRVLDEKRGKRERKACSSGNREGKGEIYGPPPHHENTSTSSTGGGREYARQMGGKGEPHQRWPPFLRGPEKGSYTSKEPHSGNEEEGKKAFRIGEGYTKKKEREKKKSDAR